MEDRNFIEERIEIRKLFNDMQTSLRKLHRHKTGLALLDEEEIEFHSMNISICMHEVNEMVDEQLALLDPEKLSNGNGYKSRPGKENQTSH